MKSAPAAFIVATLIAALTHSALAFAMDPRLGWTTNDERAALMFAANAYADKNCTFEVDDTALLLAIRRLGYSIKDVSAEKGDTIQLWLSRFMRDRSAACISIQESFGPNGTLQPNLMKGE